MRVSDFDYPLPEGLIADRPAHPRSSSRLLELASDGSIHDCRMAAFPALIGEDDLLVFNNTRVIPARLYGRKSTGGRSKCW